MTGRADWKKMTAALAAAVLMATTGCGDDDDTADTEAAATEAPAPEAETAETEPAPEATEAEPAETEPPETEPAVTEAPEASEPQDTEEPEAAQSEDAGLDAELCAAWDQVDEPGGVDQLLSMMTDDVVLTDTGLEADLVGIEAVRDYVTSDYYAPWDTMACGAVVVEGSWGAGSYTLSSTTDPSSSQGISAVHWTDGKVDRQIAYYTKIDEQAPAPSTEYVEDPTVAAYCEAWDNGVDVDAVLSHLAPEVEFTAVEPLVGKEAVAEFIEADFDYDKVECGEVLVVNGEWAAGTVEFTNTESGVTLGGVNVLRIDEEGLIAEHHPHLDSGA